MIPDFKRGDLVIWHPDYVPEEAIIGVLLGFYDNETRDELESLYDASEVIVDALVHFPHGSEYVLMHQLTLFDNFAKKYEYMKESELSPGDLVKIVSDALQYFAQRLAIIVELVDTVPADRSHKLGYERSGDYYLIKLASTDDTHVFHHDDLVLISKVQKKNE